jgi:hypothetical protein
VEAAAVTRRVEGMLILLTMPKLVMLTTGRLLVGSVGFLLLPG